VTAPDVIPEGVRRGDPAALLAWPDSLDAGALRSLPELVAPAVALAAPYRRLGATSSGLELYPSGRWRLRLPCSSLSGESDAVAALLSRWYELHPAAEYLAAALRWPSVCLWLFREGPGGRLAPRDPHPPRGEREAASLGDGLPHPRLPDLS
jgi:hypothetical protein